MDEPLETSELLAFSKAVDARSLSRAAAELGVPRATISRRLARLEERLGVRLIRRTTRSLALTDAGEALHRTPASCSTRSTTPRRACAGPTTPSAATCASRCRR